MSLDYLTPVPDIVLAHKELLPQQALGKKIKIHIANQDVPDLQDVDIAIIGILENRNDPDYIGENLQLHDVRKAFYALFSGSWNVTLADLGDIKKGASIADTYYAITETIKSLLKKKIIPLILGGTQDLIYPNYRAYDTILPMVNIVNVDSKFDLGDSSKELKNNNFVGKIILNQPHNLFNYATVGYQTYFNAQEEKDLMENLYFETYRLGEVSNDITLVEPVMRDANIVSIDLKAVKASELGGSNKFSPNGFDGKEICAIARYAGISNKVSSFGVYEYKVTKNDTITPMLIAQILWYFIEGVNYRVEDDNFSNETTYQKFTTLTNEQEMVFYKSNKTGRWWVEIPFLTKVDNKLKRHTLLPCTHQDYLDACNNKIPERWYKAWQKNSV